MDMRDEDKRKNECNASAWREKDFLSEPFHVTNLNIAQVKQKHGIIERENYYKPKSPGAKGPVDLCLARTGVATETSKQPGTSDMRIKAIEEAMRHFQMIWEKRTTGWNLTVSVSLIFYLDGLMNISYNEANIY